ncbi:hypothetical protein ACIPC1_04125 [Streptomyces sp. NPDC087263]|uniref:hypothetical protein n=1 Tax=Streptomyces sp. NPDC087263 TaxID=3365773 RepID=UPI00382B37ED
MDLEKTPVERPAPQAQAEGCLAVAIRIPVRIVVLVLVLPVRMVWDALVVGGRFLRDYALRPVGRALAWVAWALFVWPCVTVWRYVVVPVAKAVGWLAYVLVVVPLVWIYRTVLTPIGHAVAWLARGIGAGIGWVLRGIGAGIGWVYAWVLTPVGHAVAWLGGGVGAVLAAVGTGLYTTVAWLVRQLFVVPGVWLYAWVLAPVGRGIAWTVRGLGWLVRMIFTGIGLACYWTLRVLLVLPALAVWRWVLVPVGRVLAVIGREVGTALGHAWRVAGYISLAVGRFLGRLFRWIFVEPVRWVYQAVLTPVGHAVRDTVLRPAAEAARSVGRVTRQALAAARESARQARADFRRMLFGTPGEPEPVPREPAPAALVGSGREPGADETRTLDRSKTALTKD